MNDDDDKDNEAVNANEASGDDELADCDTKPGNSDSVQYEKQPNVAANSVEAECLEKHRLSQAKYRASQKGKATHNKFIDSEKGKATKAEIDKTYLQTPKGKATKADANKTYFETHKGKATNAETNKTYFETPKGKGTKAEANKTYFETLKGKYSKSKANKTYKFSMHGRRIAGKRMRKYMRKHRMEERISIDLSGDARSGNTKNLQDYEARPEIVNLYNFCKTKKKKL